MSAEIETLHRPFAAWLTKLRGQVAYTYHRSDKPTGATLGDADFVLYAASRCLHIEFKDKETRISPAQVKRHAELAAVGVTVHILRDLDAAIALALEWRRTLGMAGQLATGKPALPERNLRIFGNSVLEYRDGSLHHVRVATPEDKLRLTSI
jgi:hypothetical protein